MTDLLTEPRVPEQYRDPSKYELLESGAIRDKSNGKFVHNIGVDGKYAIDSPERARELTQRKRHIGIMSQLKGLAKASDVELPPDAELEQIVNGAGDTLEALTRHFAETFKKSANLRGMAEGYKSLAAPLVGETNEPTTNTMNIFVMPESVARVLLAIREAQGSSPSVPSNTFTDIVDGKLE